MDGPASVAVGMARKRTGPGVLKLAIGLATVLRLPLVLCSLMMLLGGNLGATAASVRYADIVIDANSGKILHEESADAARFPASLTKMMTLYIVFDMLDSGRVTLDTPLKVSGRAAAAQPSKLGLRPGDTISVRDAIRALVTKSANDVAIAVAENLAGSEDKFARYMTAKAKKIGMKSTTFRNASGLPHPAQKTTARDLLTLALHLNDDFPQYYGYFKTSYFKFRGARHRNHNGLLFTFEGTDGIKTGYTRASGFNLVTSVRKNGKHVIGVVLGGKTSRERNSRMRMLMRNALAVASKTKSRKPAVAKEPLVAASDGGKNSGITVVKKKKVEIAVASLSSAGKPKKKLNTMESLIDHYVGLTKSANGRVLTPAEAAIVASPASEAAWASAADQPAAVVAASSIVAADRRLADRRLPTRRWKVRSTSRSAPTRPKVKQSPGLVACARQSATGCRATHRSRSSTPLPTRCGSGRGLPASTPPPQSRSASR